MNIPSLCSSGRAVGAAVWVLFLSGCMGGSFSPQLSGTYRLVKPTPQTVPQVPPLIDVSMRYSLQGGALLPVIRWSWGGGARLAFTLDQILQCGMRTQSNGQTVEECWAAALPLPSTTRITGGLEPTCFAQSMVFASIRWNLNLKLLMEAYQSAPQGGTATRSLTLSPSGIADLQPQPAAVAEVRRVLSRDHALKFQVRLERQEVRRESRCTAISGPNAEQYLSLPADVREFEFSNTQPWERQSEDLLTAQALREGDEFLFHAAGFSSLSEAYLLPWFLVN